MQFVVHMKLESDAIFGNGMSMPGGEDICVQTDAKGFPFFKGSTLKGIFREELMNYLAWDKQVTMPESEAVVKRLMGEGGCHELCSPGKVIFSNLYLHPQVISRIEKEKLTPLEVTDMFTYVRTFTSLKEGIAREGFLRSARCIKKGLNFYGTCTCGDKDAQLTEEILGYIKWVGTMRSRGFGKVRITKEGDGQ